jgi:hypothetical protein
MGNEDVKHILLYCQETKKWKMQFMSKKWLYTGLFTKNYTLSKIYFTSTIEHTATCYIYTEGTTLKVIFTPYVSENVVSHFTLNLSRRIPASRKLFPVYLSSF